VPEPQPRLTLDKAVSLVKDVFVAAAERDIYTGDGLHIETVSAAGIQTETMSLRHD